MKYISEQVALAAADQSILTLPARYVGLVRRLKVRNDTGAQRTLAFNDQFTPDISGKLPGLGVTTVTRGGAVIANAATWELDGTVFPICKLLNNFRVVSDVVGCILSYQIEVV
jgi:hypothetical protein